MLVLQRSAGEEAGHEERADVGEDAATRQHAGARRGQDSAAGGEDDARPDAGHEGATALEETERRGQAAGMPAMPLWGWIAVLTVTLAGGLLRFWRLDHPHTLVFDETYYVKQGHSLFRAGYEMAWKDKREVVDAQWADGNSNVFTATPEFIVHPPVGKWMIGFGEWVFGPASSWGWRFSAAVVGTLSILMISLIARRLFGSTLLGVVAGLLLAVDGVHLVHSRISLLDGVVMFWALAAFGCLVVDRDIGRQRLAERVAARRAQGLPVRGAGPGTGMRWWRVAAAVCLGLCAGTKWSGLYFAVAFGLLVVCWEFSARRQAGIRNWVGGGLREGVLAGLVMAPTALAAYLASWTGWFLSSEGYDRQWAADHPSEHFGWIPDALRGLWYFHTQMWWSNTHITSSHPFEANPWSWLVLGRPTAFMYTYPQKGVDGCTVDKCMQAITAIGNPVIWWTAVACLPVVLFSWLARRDWRAGAVLIGLVGGYLPWFLYQYRTIFAFYEVAFVPWVVLIVVYTLGLALGPPGSSRVRRRRTALAGGGLVLLAVLVFWYFLPIYTGQTIPQTSWNDRMWLGGWI